jgi:hypothetical protein
MNHIDIIRTSASRPGLLKMSTRSLMGHLKFSGQTIVHLHEDVLNHDLSKDVIRYAKDCGFYDNIKIDNPPKGQGGSLTWLIEQTRSKYVLNIEDDYDVLRDIDLDRIVQIMDQSEGTETVVNQVCLNKRKTMAEKPDFKKVEIEIDGQVLTTNPHWALIPAVWRMSFIKPRWVNFKQNHHWDLNNKMKGQEANRPPDWVIKNTGTYYLGPIKEPAYVKHVGEQRSVRIGEEQQNWRS